MKKTVMLTLLLLAAFSVGAQEPFNLEVTLPETYRIASLGDEVWFAVNLINLGNQERVDVTLNYYLLNSDEEVVVSRSETVAIQTQASFVGSIQIPSDVEAGTHHIKVILDSPYGNSESDIPIVIKESKDFNSLYYIFIFLLILAVIAFIVLMIRPLIMTLRVHSRVHKIVKLKLKK